MEPREVLNSIESLIGGSGVAALVGVTALSDTSPFRHVLLGGGIGALLPEAGILLGLMITRKAFTNSASQPKPRFKMEVNGQSAVGVNNGVVNNII